MFNDIGGLLPYSARKVVSHQKMKSEQIEKLYQAEIEHLLTENILERVKVLYFKSGIITIACLEEAIVEKLQINEDAIIQKVNNVMCNTSLKKVRYLA